MLKVKNVRYPAVVPAHAIIFQIWFLRFVQNINKMVCYPHQQKNVPIAQIPPSMVCLIDTKGISVKYLFYDSIMNLIFRLQHSMKKILIKKNLSISKRLKR